MSRKKLRKIIGDRNDPPEAFEDDCPLCDEPENYCKCKIKNCIHCDQPESECICDLELD